MAAIGDSFAHIPHCGHPFALSQAQRTGLLSRTSEDVT